MCQCIEKHILIPSMSGLSSRLKQQRLLACCWMHPAIPQAVVHVPETSLTQACCHWLQHCHVSSAVACAAWWWAVGCCCMLQLCIVGHECWLGQEDAVSQSHRIPVIVDSPCHGFFVGVLCQDQLATGLLLGQLSACASHRTP